MSTYMKHQLNVAGKWFTTHPDDDSGEGCIACNVCYTGAPELFKDDEDADDGYTGQQSAVFRTQMIPVIYILIIGFCFVAAKEFHDIMQ